MRFPLADGGDGTAETLTGMFGGQLESALAHDALGRPRSARYGVLGDGRAVIDVASASGIAHLKQSELDVWSASSRGTGDLACIALREGAREILLGVGGSASVDGGLGLLSALGVRALDANGKLVPDGARGLLELARFDTSRLEPAARQARWTILCDVDAPLLGALDYAPQKGASTRDLRELERGLTNLAQLLEAQLGFFPALAGGGAAGGIPASLMALLGARCVSGIDFVLDAGGFDAALDGADLVISAEGCFDAQSLANKGPVGAARRARKRGVPTLVLAGAISGDFERANASVAALLSITQAPCSLDHARSVAADWLSRTAEQSLRVFQLGVAAAR
ncbi:MAG: glycerate kinase [Polyangiaceae bacterium]